MKTLRLKRETYSSRATIFLAGKKSNTLLLKVLKATKKQQQQKASAQRARKQLKKAVVSRNLLAHLWFKVFDYLTV